MDDEDLPEETDLDDILDSSDREILDDDDDTPRRDDE